MLDLSIQLEKPSISQKFQYSIKNAVSIIHQFEKDQMPKTNENLQEELRRKISPNDRAYQRLQRTIRVIVADKKVKHSVYDECDIKNGKDLFMRLLQVDVLCHIYRIKEDVNDKHGLNQVVPLKIPVIVGSNDQLTHLFARDLCLFIQVMCFLAFLELLFSHDHLVDFLASHSTHHINDFDILAHQSPHPLCIPDLQLFLRLGI